MTYDCEIKISNSCVIRVKEIGNCDRFSLKDKTFNSPLTPRPPLFNSLLIGITNDDNNDDDDDDDEEETNKKTLINNAFLISDTK